MTYNIFQIQDYHQFISAWQKQIDPRISRKNADYKIAQYLKKHESQIPPNNINAFLTRWKQWCQVHRIGESSRVKSVCMRIKKCFELPPREIQEFMNKITGSLNVIIGNLENPTLSSFLEAIKAITIQDCRFIKIFKAIPIQSELVRFEMAMEILKNGGFISDNINAFQIHSEERRFLLAQFAAQSNDFQLPENIHHFKISDPDKRFQIAKLAIPKHAGNVSQYIELFNIKNQDHLFELAKLLAVNENPYFLTTCLKDLQISDPNRRFELAKLTINSSNSYPLAVASHFENFVITDQEHVFELAKMCSNAPHFSREVDHFCIKDPNRRYQLAKMVVTSHPMSFTQFVLNYDISNQDQLFELAEIALQSNSGEVLPYIEQYRIQDPNRRYHLAKIAAKSVQFSSHLRKFQIKDQDQLFELAKLAFQLSGWDSPSRYIESYEIQDPKRLFEIAKIAANFDSGFYYFLPKYKITNPDELFELAKIVAQNFGLEILANIKEFKINDTKKLHEIAYIACNQMGEAFPDKRYGYECHLTNIPNTKVFDVESIRDKIELWENKELRDALHYVLDLFAILCKIHANQTHLIQFFKLHPQLLPTIFEERDAYLYWPLLSGILHLVSKNIEKPIANTPYKQMLLLLLNNLGIECPKLLNCDIRDTHLRTPIMILLSTLTDKKLNPIQRKNILEWALADIKNKDQIKTRCLMIRAIQSLNKGLDVDVENHSPEVILAQLFQKLFPNVKVENFEKRLQETFFTMRNPMAIFIYAGVHAKSPETLKTLTIFVNSIFDNHFLQVRQNSEKNPHLKFLEQNHLDTLKLYHQGSSKQTDLSVAHTETKHRHITIRQIIQDATHKHLTDEDYSKINMAHIPLEDRKLFPLNLEDKIKILSQEKGKLHKTNPEEFKKLESHVAYLKLQLSLVKLMAENATEANYNECLTAFQNALKPNTEFLNDLKSIAGLFSGKKDQNSVVLADTDDPYEIFLCGTEVEGSCQRLDGSSNLNRGLLGYLLNGQTRLLTLKTSNTIKGRAIMRLLLDGQNKPVLFVERVYPQTLDQKYKDAILSFAKEKAQKLNIPLARSGKGKLLKNLGCFINEYVDSAGGIRDTYQVDTDYINP